MKRLHTILSTLEDLGVSSVEVCFQGGGDDGEIYNVQFFDADGADIYATFNEDTPEPKVTIRTRDRVWNFEGISYKYEDKEMGLIAAIETIVYDELSDTNVDWICGYGGRGTWSLEKKGASWKKNLWVETHWLESRVAWDTTEVVALRPDSGQKMTPSMDLTSIDPDVIERATKRAEEGK
ncbi:MAG: hypothetical protein VXZ72_03940 [Chlamydiota bacterium]|nr:hypothetical protein [Chlamydiota bacterium]